MDSVLKRFIHACFNQVHFCFNWKLNSGITHMQDKVQSNPVNTDTEGAIESNQFHTTLIHAQFK